MFTVYSEGIKTHMSLMVLSRPIKCEKTNIGRTFLSFVVKDL